MTNGEKYRTVKERYHAFRKTFGTKCEDCQWVSLCSHDLSECIIRWLYMEAEEVKILPCPYCGGECEVVSHSEGHEVKCMSRYCYVGKTFESKYDAIAAHNRVARAVMEDANKEVSNG